MITQKVALIVIVTAAFAAVAVSAADYEVGQNSMLQVTDSMFASSGGLTGGETPSFALVSGKKKVKVRVVTAKNAGGSGTFMDFKGKIPAGSYCLVRGKGSDFDLEDVVAWDFEVSSPEVHTAVADKIQPLGSVTLSGQYFGHMPKVYLTCDWKGKRRVKPCKIVESAYYKNPFVDGDNLWPMDVESGASKLRITLPNYPSDAENLAVELRSSNGSCGIFLRAGDPSPGDLVGWEQKGTLDHKWFFFPPTLAYTGYLYRSFACGKGIFEDFFSIFTKLGGWALVTTSKLPSNPFTSGKYDVELYALKYMAAYGNEPGAARVLASGLLALPKAEQLKSASSVVFHSFQHGTMLEKSAAPSVSMGPEMGVALIFSVAAGHVLILPDHIGLGAAALEAGMEKVFHPYCVSEPDAVGDAWMIPAAKAFLTTKNKTFAAKVAFSTPLLGGYSEGGYITLALCRELEANGSLYGVTSVAASCPMAGPHSLSYVMLNRLLDESQTYPVQYFAPYMLVTYNSFYNIYDSPAKYFKEPYDTTVVPLIDGYHTSSEVNSAMPASRIPAQALQTDFANSLRGQTGDFYNAIKANDLIGGSQTWRPKAKTLLVHGANDDCVMYENSSDADMYFNDRGMPITDHRLVKVEDNLLIDALSLFMIRHGLYFPYAAGEYWSWVANGYKFTTAE